MKPSEYFKACATSAHVHDGVGDEVLESRIIALLRAVENPELPVSMYQNNDLTRAALALREK